MDIDPPLLLDPPSLMQPTAHAVLPLESLILVSDGCHRMRAGWSVLALSLVGLFAWSLAKEPVLPEPVLVAPVVTALRQASRDAA